MNTQDIPLYECRSKHGKRALLVTMLLGVVPMMSVAAEENPTREQVVARTQRQIEQNREIGEYVETQFLSRSRSSDQDASSEARLSEAIAASLKGNESQASVKNLECRESVCKAQIRMSKSSDRPAALFALLSSHECGLTVLDEPGERRSPMLVAYIDCANK
jgi:hypothetical protein